MSGVKEQIIEKSEQILTHPTAQKAISTYAVGTGGMVSFEIIQGWLGIISVIIGIVAGILVIRSNYRKAQGLEIDNQIKRIKLEAELKKSLEAEDES